MDLVESTIWNSRIPKICETLGVESWREIEEELCVPLRSMVSNIEALQMGWPEEFREKIEALYKAPDPQPEKHPSPENQSKPATQSEKTQKETGTPRRNRVPWPLIGIPLLVVCVLCVSGAFVGWRAISSLTSNTRTPLPPTLTFTPPATNTQTPLPTATATFTLSPTSTETPTATYTLTPTFTSTPVPTDTKPPIGLLEGDELRDDRVSPLCLQM